MLDLKLGHASPRCAIADLTRWTICETAEPSPASVSMSTSDMGTSTRGPPPLRDGPQATQSAGDRGSRRVLEALAAAGWPLSTSSSVQASRVGIILVGQEGASLGPDDTIRNRLAGTVIVHQLKQPDEAAALAGRKWVMERTEQTLVLGHTGLGRQRAGNRYVLHPDEVRALSRGEAFVLHTGQALRIHTRAARLG